MPKQKLVVFDIDGTLIRWQLFHAVVDRLAKRELLGPSAQEEVHTARMHWKRREHAEAFKDYEREIVKIYDSALNKLSTDEFDEAVKDIAREYQEQTYTYTRDLIKDLKAKGYVTLAISGSQHEVVSQIAELYDFDDFVGSRYERVGKTFTGKKYVASYEKKKVLEDLIQKHQLTLVGSYAVGDSASDIPMLEMVENPIAFNPDIHLFNKAQEQGWKVVIERKNVIYELEDNNGKYQLV